MIGEAERWAVSRDRYGMNIVGHVTLSEDYLWKIEGRMDEFNTAESAANELVNGNAKPST
jgi:hypothetical protein